MKKMLTAMLAVTLLAGCNSTASQPAATSTPENTNNAGAINLNATKADMSAYAFIEDDDPAFLEVTTEESLRMFVNGTGVVVYSYETCPWCNRILPILDEAAKEYGTEVFYVNIYSDAFMALDNEEKSDQINALYQCLDPILEKEKDPETGEDKAVMQVPEVVAVKDGEIVSHHMGVVDDFSLDPEHLDEYQVTDEQKQELKEIYLDMFASIE